MTQRKSMMPPPGGPGHGVAIIIAAHPDDSKDKGRMPPPGMSIPDEDAPPMAGEEPDDKKDAGGKVTPEAAGVVREDEHCAACKNYSATTGECSKVQSSLSPEDGCAMYFDPIGEDEDEEGDDSAPETSAGESVDPNSGTGAEEN